MPKTKNELTETRNGLLETKNDLPEERRKGVVELLNSRLADLADLHLQAKTAHWNVKGPSFYSLHLLFDQVAETARESADEVAERAVQLGGVARGTVNEVSRNTQLPDYPLDIKDGLAHCDALSDSLARCAQALRQAIDRADELGDKDTADLFTELSRDIDKQLWMVEAHLQAER